jgi:hypothetical protein
LRSGNADGGHGVFIVSQSLRAVLGTSWEDRSRFLPLRLRSGNGMTTRMVRNDKQIGDGDSLKR